MTAAYQNRKFTQNTTKFYYSGMYIFCMSDHKLGTCSTILKAYQKGRCIIRVNMGGLFCLSVVVDRKNYSWTFFFAHQFSLVLMYLTCGPGQLFFFRCSPETPKAGHPCSRLCHRDRETHEQNRATWPWASWSVQSAGGHPLPIIPEWM